MRIACLLVPDLPFRAELRARPEWAGERLVVTSGPDTRAEVVAASPEAIAAGIVPPCPLARARAICPEVRVRTTCLASEQAARETLLDTAFSCAPRAAPAPRATGVFAAEAAVFLDAVGVETLFRSEAGFAAALGARARAIGFPGVVTVASSRSVAHLAARAQVRSDRCAVADGPVRVLPPGEEAAFLAPLSIDLLEPDDRLAQQLTRFGVHTVRDLLALPRRASAHRLGPALLRLMTRARGEEVEPPLPEALAREIQETAELDFPVAHLEPLRFILRRLLAHLLERLVLRGLAFGALELSLGLEGGGQDIRRIASAAPTRDLRVLLRLIDLALEGRPPEAAIENVRLATEGCTLRQDQLDLFRPKGPDPAALDETLSELEVHCGLGRVGAPEVADDHRPTAFEIVPFRPGRASPGPDAPLLPPRERDALAVRALRPPVAAQVQIRCGMPAWVRSAVATGDVVEASGPWRTTGHWWSEQRFALDYYDVRVNDGTVLRLAFDFLQRRWSIDAIYD